MEHGEDSGRGGAAKAVTQKQQIILSCISGICGFIFLYIASFNGYAAVQGMRGKRAGSMVPLIGGFCGSFSFLALFELLDCKRTWGGLLLRL
jgi:hypothetical protein